MKRAKLALATASLLCAAPVAAVPFHGCTFWQSQYELSSWMCANFNVIYPGCMIVHCTPVGCITYPGALFTGWMPDHFIEVTNRPGKSIFTGVDTPMYLEQMAVAKLAWSGLGDVYPAVRTSQEHPVAASEFSMYFGRTLPTPYGPYGWSLKTVGFTAGTWLPTCFSAISELAPETWVDRPDSGDRELTARWLAQAGECVANALVASVASDAISPPEVHSGLSSCPMYPLPSALQKVQAQKGKAATQMWKQCMGVLGPLLPRTGWTDGENYTAAQRLAWRTASLAEDYFDSDVGVSKGDKWLMMWPPQTSPPQCFIPGSAGLGGSGIGGRPSSYNLWDMQLRVPAYDMKEVPAGETDYVFAVFRPRAKCVEPWEQAAVRLEIAMYVPEHTLECLGYNAAMPVPMGAP